MGSARTTDGALMERAQSDSASLSEIRRLRVTYRTASEIARGGSQKHLRSQCLSTAQSMVRWSTSRFARGRAVCRATGRGRCRLLVGIRVKIVDSLVVDLLLDCRRQRCVRGMASGCDPFRSTLVRQTCNASCGATGPQTSRSGRANYQPR